MHVTRVADHHQSRSTSWRTTIRTRMPCTSCSMERLIIIDTVVLGSSSGLRLEWFLVTVWMRYDLSLCMYACMYVCTCATVAMLCELCREFAYNRRSRVVAPKWFVGEANMARWEYG